jgi:predicted metal-binding membrane protein
MAALDSAVRSLAARERVLVLSGVVVVTALGAAYLFAWHPGLATAWNGGEAWLVFAMWAAMMVAMMTPGAAPMLLAFARLSRGRGDGEPGGLALPAFLGGYLAVWTGFSAVAALAHWGLHAVELLSPDMVIANPVASGILLLSAGAYQLTPFKTACLAKCRTPMGFLFGEWRDGSAGAFVMGVRHGAYCVGCCWLLMALLFVGGVMSPFWIVVLTLIAMAERILPFGESVAHGVAAGAIGWGLWMLAGMLV